MKKYYMIKTQEGDFVLKSNINLNLYKTFYEVCKYKSISQAAKQTFTTQPAISKAIKKLESDLNVQLFVRNRDGIELTAKGKELLFFVEQSFNSLEIAERTMYEDSTLDKGKLNIGMPSNVATFYLFDKVVEFHKKYPNIEITIFTGSSTKLSSLLDSHEVDFVIDTAPYKNISKDNVYMDLFKVNYCFVSKNKLSIHSLKEIENQPLILPIPKTANRNDLDYIFIESNIQPTNILNIRTSEMIIAAVKKDLGIGYVIEDLVNEEIKKEELYKVEVETKLPTVQIGLGYNEAYLTIASKTFIKDYMNISI